MTKTVYVGSKSQSEVVVEIESRGLDLTDAQRWAVQFVRARHHIGDPIALSEHEAALRKRQLFLAQFAPKMPDQYRTVPFFLQHEDTRYRRN